MPRFVGLYTKIRDARAWETRSSNLNRQLGAVEAEV